MHEASPACMKKYLRSDFSKNVFRLMTGTTISQIIPFAVMPILSRLFTPEEFGLYAFYLSVVTLLVVFSTGRYELAIPLPQKETDAWQILVLSFSILSMFSLILLLLLLLFNAEILHLLNRPAIGSWLLLLPLFVFMTGTYNILTMWTHRTKNFAVSANSKVHLSIWENLSSLILGFRKNGFNFGDFGQQITGIFAPKNIVLSLNNIGFSGLLISRLFGLSFSNVYLFMNLNRKNSGLQRKTQRTEIGRLAREYKSFPGINMLHAASDELKNSGLSFLILYFFLDRVLGIYNQTYRLLRAPLGIIGSAFGHVFFQEVAALSYSQKPITPLIQKTLKKLFLIALPLFAAIFIISPWFFTLFLGPKWSEVGVYAQYMTPWLFVNFIFSPVSHVALVVGKQMQFWLINLLSSSLVFASMFAAGFFFDDLKMGLILISITQIFYSIYLHRWLQRIAAVHDQKCNPPA